MECQFCSKQINQLASFKSHEVRCKLNPNKISWKRSPKAGQQKGAIPWNKGTKDDDRKYYEAWKVKIPNEVLFVENCEYSRRTVKLRIIYDKLKQYKCEICNMEPFWNNKPMPLILDHKNGINNDNRLENLRFVCSNCDSQLDTYKSKNRRK